jgi:hypothetical protein
MTIEELRRAHELAKAIDSDVAKLAVFREAKTITIGLGRTNLGALNLDHQTEFEAEEIADAVVAALEHRIARKRNLLAQFGVNAQ